MKILIAVDGSVYTQKALAYLADNRGMFVDKHELVVVHVCPGIPGHVARHVSKDVVDSYYTDETAKVLDPVKAFFAQHGITGYQVDTRHGHAAEEIIKAAKAAGAGLIVMGTHGHGIFGRTLMGSVATRVVSDSDATVLLVR